MSKFGACRHGCQTTCHHDTDDLSQPNALKEVDTCRKIGRDIFFSGADTPHADGSIKYIRADVAAADARKLRDALDSFPDHGNKTEWWNDVGQPALSEFNAKHGAKYLID